MVAYIALFFSLTGVAYAAGPLKPGDPAGGDLTGTYPNPEIATGAVGASELATDAIASRGLGGGSPKIADGAVAGSEVHDGSIAGIDILDGSLTGFDVGTGSLAGINIANGSVLGTDIGDGSVERADLAAEARGPAAFTTFDEVTGLLCSDFCTQGNLTGLPAGSYLIFGKIDVTAKSALQDYVRATCRLHAADNSTDESIISLAGTDAHLDGGTVSMHLVHTFAAPGDVKLQCWDEADGAAKGSHLRITAIRLGSVGL